MDRKTMLGFAAVAAMTMGAILGGPFAERPPFDEPPRPRQHHRKAEPSMAGVSKKKFKGSKAAKRANRRHK